MLAPLCMPNWYIVLTFVLQHDILRVSGESYLSHFKYIHTSITENMLWITLRKYIFLERSRSQLSRNIHFSEANYNGF